MIARSKIVLGAGLLILILAGSSPAGPDSRAGSLAAEQKKQMLIQKAAEEKQAALREQAEAAQAVKADEKRLTFEVTRLKSETRDLEKKIQALQDILQKNSENQGLLKEQLAATGSEIRELKGFVRVSADDLAAELAQSHQSAFDPDRSQVLERVRDEERFPGLDDIQGMVDLYFQEIALSSAVQIRKGPFVDLSGNDSEADILVVGNFSAAYRKDSQTGFLLYSDASRRFFALSKPPPAGMQKQIRRYMAGETDLAPMDISRGGALRQLTHRLSPTDQISSGGPIVWPILGILVLGGLIVLERCIFLFRVKIDADAFMTKIFASMADGKWDDCRTLCLRHNGKVVPGIILAGLQARGMDRPDMENVLQERILREIPKLERYLSTLGVLAAIAPLLGLLGTVAGMIETFHVITYFGTGDPKMMSGGISQALVTTMLGLSVAIPLMLGHTMLTRRVDILIARMEEKAVAFVNRMIAGLNAGECP